MVDLGQKTRVVVSSELLQGSGCRVPLCEDCMKPSDCWSRDVGDSIPALALIPKIGFFCLTGSYLFQWEGRAAFLITQPQLLTKVWDMDWLLWKREHCALAVSDPFAAESRSQALVKENMEERDAASTSTAHLACSLSTSFHPEKTWTRQRTDPRPCLKSCDVSK